jgi:hypothetical protein
MTPTVLFPEPGIPIRTILEGFPPTPHHSLSISAADFLRASVVNFFPLFFAFITVQQSGEKTTV